MPVAGPLQTVFFAGQMVYPWGPILIEYIHMEPKYGIQGVSPPFLPGQPIMTAVRSFQKVTCFNISLFQIKK